jgi:hypothetical protein
MGNTNALTTARFSRRYSHVAAGIADILRVYRHNLGEVAARSNLETRRLRARYIVAAELALQRTPALAYDLATTIFAHRRRVLDVENGEVLLALVCRQDRPLTLSHLIPIAAWFIRRDPVLAAALVDVLQPPFEAALDALYPAVPSEADPDQTTKTIKQSKTRQTESAAPRGN